MEFWLLVVIGILLIIIFSLVIKLFFVHKTVREIEAQFTERLMTETNTLIDISHRNKIMCGFAKRLNTELRKLRKERHRFQQGDLELKNAVTNISHDLRTPLTAISGYLDLLDNAEKSEEAERYIKVIRNRTEVLRQLTEELFCYSVVTSPEYDNDVEFVSVNSVLEESILGFYAVLQERNITPNISMPENKVFRKVNRAALSRIFSNLLNNAMLRKMRSGDYYINTILKIIISVRQESENADKTVMKRSKSEEKEAEEILEICSKTYAKAEKEGKLDDLEMIRDLIKELGEKGFTAVDSENQVNMTEYEKLIQFSEKAEAKKNGRMTVVEVAKGGSCIIRNMETHDGIVNMIRSYCIYENGKLKQSSEDIYRTESWEYTEDGHLMFSGRLAFEGSYEVTRNEIMEYMAYRVLSLDETCRELNRKYILPIGYERNNMFLTDWSEEEFAELDFYDMFDLFYQENHTANGEFTFGNAMGTSAVYLISKEKFEPVIKSKFKISSEVLQSKTVYYPCEEVYEYKPRGLEETEYPEYPYPEVIGYVNNDDGTLTLKVQAVFPYRGVSKAYIHEVTVRDTKDGGIQYVGNRIIEPINNPEIRWHVPRLTRTEWEELYGDN